MDSTISYINDRNEYKIAVIPEEIRDEVIDFEVDTCLYTYIHPIMKTRSLLHSLADRPCLVEEPNCREHWMWRGRLHRLNGPAFICESNREWYVFGVPIGDEATFNANKEYFLRIESFANANGIDLHCEHDGVDVHKFFLDFSSEDHLLECSAKNIIPICDRNTGDVHTVPFEDLTDEVYRKERGPGLIVAAILGTAAAFAASKVKKQLATATEKKISQQHSVVRS